MSIIMIGLGLLPKLYYDSARGEKVELGQSYFVLLVFCRIHGITSTIDV